MSTPSHYELEHCLTQFYVQQAEHYRRILERIERLPEIFTAGQHADAELEQLRQMLEELEALDRRWGPLKDEWKSLSTRPGPAMVVALHDVEQLLVHLMSRLAAAEQSAQEARQRLLPQVSEVSRRQQMRTAYASARDRV